MMDSASVRLVDSSGYELARAWLHAHSAVMSGGSSTAPAPTLRHIKLPPLGEPTAAQLRARRPLQTTKLPPGQHLYLREQRAVMDHQEEEEEEDDEAEGAAPAAAAAARMATGDQDNDEDEGADGEHDGEDDGGGEEGEEEEEEEEGEEEEEEEDGEDEEADPGGAPAAAAAEGCGEAEGMDWSAGGAAASDAPAAGAAADWARDKVLSTTRVEPVDGREGAPVKRELVATSAVASATLRTTRIEPVDGREGVPVKRELVATSAVASDTAGDHASAGSSSAVASVARDTAASDGARDGAHDGAPKYGSTQNPMIWERQAAADDAPTQERHTTAPASEDGHSSSELHSELHGSPDDHDGAGVGAGATETEMDRRAVGSREPGGGHHDGARDGARDSARDSDPGGVRERRQRRPPSWSREPPQVMAVDCL